MKPSLVLKMGQQLTMTPQLQQAIKLLQLSTLDLQQEVQQALESNPMLEAEEGSDSESSSDHDQSGDNNEFDSATDYNTLSEGEQRKQEQQSVDSANNENEVMSDDWQDNIPEDLPVDTAWDDVYQSSLPPSSGSGGGDNDDYNPAARASTTESLQSHLEWQLNLTPMSDTDRAIAVTIIDALTEDGYLSCSCEELLEGIEEELEIELDEVEAVLRRIQQFDPVGVAARSLTECLLIQLAQLPESTPHLGSARLVVEKYINLLGTHDYAQLMRKSRLKEADLKAAIELIQTLNPKPGDSIQSSEPEYVIPDVTVKKVNGRWTVELNPDAVPRVRINSGYASLVKRADNSADNTYLKNHLQEARWFLKSLQSRNETLMKVATQIVEHQRGFLEYGDEAMKPLVLHDIAEAVSMHESTISRVTTQKYMHTPRGIFELKYFFSSHVSTASGGECSSTAIRAIIKKLVAAENPKKPLSDSKIAGLLAEQGIKVARRTIAKYRESLSIAPSNERKRLV
ncbi:RNA polymerase factor sigma-54 [Aestuariirhabdus litorea]|uniref:RNA polymerase sigma-54 factor n=1 Tax=Aestuariirhabdus litorea TaxID=2528527 RepID=A0A3P3VQ58_9GAMM|nr:RNA polymerase factor sigma-54 [Aestuariirhabdus litorea]RRJ83719.1 RNA polymerase factor sigma-54 [Aestuariirhabdus litorea]RWW96942.1 RNA polymerase factor sigma-54 [Endozoicomonadaceae bacterium GTF-13]